MFWKERNEVNDGTEKITKTEVRYRYAFFLHQFYAIKGFYDIGKQCTNCDQTGIIPVNVRMPGQACNPADVK